MDSILSKAKAYTNSPQFQQKVEAKTDSAIMNGSSGGTGAIGGIESINAAASKFIDVVIREVEGQAGALGPTAIDAATQLDYGTPYKVGKNKYEIGIWFSGDLHRDSLAPSRYSGVDNIVALLNNGYQAGHSVYGVWHGHGDDPIQSLAARGGLRFVDAAVRDFMGNYGRDFGVTDIKVSEVYK